MYLLLRCNQWQDKSLHVCTPMYCTNSGKGIVVLLLACQAKCSSKERSPDRHVQVNKMEKSEVREGFFQGKGQGKVDIRP